MTALLLDALATYRLTRLVTADTILAGPREAAVRYAYARWRPGGFLDAEQGADVGGWAQLAEDDPGAPKLATLVTCAYCAGIWVAFGIVGARRFRWWPKVRDGLALASAAVMLKRLEP